MGSLVGHVAPGFAFLVLGLWHLYNHIKSHAMHPKSYTSLSWFPASKQLKYLELYLIMLASSISVAMELFIGPDRHQPFDPDGTIPSNHLRNFEHSSISLTFIVYASFAIILDKIRPAAHYGLTQLLGAAAFGQQLLLFHLHSSDHTGPEGQYHMLLQLVIFMSLTTSLILICLPKSFLVSFVRSLSIFSQGVWLIVMGFMLWTPELIPKGCRMNFEEGHDVVRCAGEESLHRAKSLVNIQFSWFLIGIFIFGNSLYLAIVQIYGKKVEYQALENKDGDSLGSYDVESQKQSKLEETKSFVQIGKAFGPMDMER